MTPVGEIVVSLMDRAHSGVGLPELLCQDACGRLPIRGAAIALLDASGVIQMTAASDAVTLEVQRLQLTLGEGPCTDAFRKGALVLLPDLTLVGPGRWPAYTPTVLAQGVRAVFSYPLRIGGIMLGALDLYAAEAGMLDDQALGQALHYVDAAVLVILHLQSLDDLRRHDVANPLDAGALEVAFGTSPQVHQATGMVSVQAGVGLADALLLLRAHAYAEGQTIGAVAAAVVARTVRINS